MSSTTPTTRRIVAISAGTGEPSSSRMLADRLLSAVTTAAAAQDIAVDARVIELRPLATAIAEAVVTGTPGPAVEGAIDLLRDADAVVVSAPVYTAGPSGLLKSFLDVLDTDLLVATPVALAATAGTARHALVVDEQLRSTFAYLRALSAPSSVFAAPEDWAQPELERRIGRLANELVALVAADIRGAIRGRAWGEYQHASGPAAVEQIALDTDLMRMATGGR